jgi:hypothetical protein
MRKNAFQRARNRKFMSQYSQKKIINALPITSYTTEKETYSKKTFQD